MAIFKVTEGRLTVSGILDSDSEAQLRDGFEKLVAGGAETVTVDLSEVELITSICIGALVVLWIDLTAAGKRAELITSPAVKKVLDMTGLSAVLMVETGKKPSGGG